MCCRFKDGVCLSPSKHMILSPVNFLTPQCHDCLLSERAWASHAGPVPDVGALVAVVVDVEVVFPHVVVLVDVMLVHVVAHADVGEDVLELGVVGERDGREWVEVVRVHGLGSAQVLPLLLNGSLFLFLAVGLVRAEVETSESRVDQEVGAPAHLAEGA